MYSTELGKVGLGEIINFHYFFIFRLKVKEDVV